MNWETCSLEAQGRIGKRRETIPVPQRFPVQKLFLFRAPFLGCKNTG
jgi:hypothetical protein